MNHRNTSLVHTLESINVSRKRELIENSTIDQHNDKKQKTFHSSSDSSENDYENVSSTDDSFVSSDSEDLDNTELEDHLCNEDCFNNLSKKEKKNYITKIKKILINEEIPSIKDIIDYNFNPSETRHLIYERLKLNGLNKFSPEYELIVINLVNSIKKIRDRDQSERKNLEDLENKLRKQSNFDVPIKERILTSSFDEKTKSILFDKYLYMLTCDHDEASKYKSWINTVLSIPLYPKKLMTETSPLSSQNMMISKLISELLNKLNEKIYGMDIIKEEFVCIIANMLANPKSIGKAIGLLGPPGIGKTKIVHILSEVLGLPMEKISFGGKSGSSFLEGHEFTYKHAEPGCIVKSIIRMGYTNGIIYFDEIDKISKSEKGNEIEHSLLNIIDESQNYNFRDKFMPDIPIDLSNNIFIYSLNGKNNLDQALADRMPIIKCDGYTVNEKIAILQKFLLPEVLHNHGMSEKDVLISDKIARYLVLQANSETGHSMEKTGVRELKKILNRIIGRINIYRIASINNKMNLKLSFVIKNFSIPYKLTTCLIDSIICDKTSANDMYL